MSRRSTRARLWVLAAIFATLSGCGGLQAGATDAGVRPDSTTSIAAMSGDDASDGAEDAASSFVPSDAGIFPGLPPVRCTDGGTRLSGTLYDPAGTNPLAGAIVYIPKYPQVSLQPIALGTGSCSDSCDPTLATITANTYVSVTETDSHGAFSLDAPTGKGIPLVFQLGKWRRQVSLDTRDCVNTTVSTSMSRLPRNQSEGDIPQMAILTGACDELACFMRDIGLDASEFTGPSGGGRLHVYKGAGPAPDLAGGGTGPAGDCSTSGCPLWASKAALEKYDLVLMGCECGEHNETKPDMGPMHDWLDEGGRLLATHYQATWFKNGPTDVQGVARWLPSEMDGPTAGPFQVDTSFIAGNALRSWLTGLGAANAAGTIQLVPADVSTSVSDVSQGEAARWIYVPSPSQLDSSSVSYDTKLLAFPTPVGGVSSSDDGGSSPIPPYCGRVFFTDVHAGGGGVARSSPVPASCAGGAMSAEEKALEYVFFNLSGPCWVPSPVHGVPHTGP